MHAELPSYGPRSALTQADRIDAYLRVLNALMLRDMRTRFLGSWWGYVAQVLWPVAHMFIISLAMVYSKRPPPFGDSIMIFAASGAVPALAFQYISRECMKGVMMNKPLTYYPQVRILDVAFARVLVEIVNSFLGVMVIFLVLALAGLDPLPADLIMAISGYLCAITLGIGMGTVNVAISIMFPGWLLISILLGIVIYFSCGVMFLAHTFPAQIYTLMKWHPLLQIVEWVRLGYDPHLPIEIDYFYVVMWCISLLGVGLFLERTVSRRFM